MYTVTSHIRQWEQTAPYIIFPIHQKDERIAFISCKIGSAAHNLSKKWQSISEAPEIWFNKKPPEGYWTWPHSLYHGTIEKIVYGVERYFTRWNEMTTNSTRWVLKHMLYTFMLLQTARVSVNEKYRPIMVETAYRTLAACCVLFLSFLFKIFFRNDLLINTLTFST
jgi:hypothetical protein